MELSRVSTDKTPPDWSMPGEGALERWVKRPLRPVLYPPYLRAIHPYLARKYDPSGSFDCDQWFWGTRGMEFQLARSRIEHRFGIRGRSVLIEGCGTGRDVPSWLEHHPRRVVGVDLLDYSRAWNEHVRAHGSAALQFRCADLTRLDGFEDASFDIVASDCVLEHVTDLDAVVAQSKRVLVPGGLLYATFGPLWFGHGGDHISGYDHHDSGFNHLLLDPDEYERYLDGAGPFSHREEDGRTWIKLGLFSYKRPSEYLDAFARAGFEKLYLGIAIHPLAVRTLHRRPDLKTRLLRVATEQELCISAMTVMYRKRTD